MCIGISEKNNSHLSVAWGEEDLNLTMPLRGASHLVTSGFHLDVLPGVWFLRITLKGYDKERVIFANNYSIRLAPLRNFELAFGLFMGDLGYVQEFSY
ncbi:hypothetical protein CEXT_789931 [Caerostris extrusa]|uniref:Uncharacterized protein n=1 Tax=Caerostris extrusa TaxID=172846 RepID=A0AAV4M664_CAEEX|nr:hypothetical protein CEXT_789931 [Caerostris extrusa]